ncbi:MAG: WD40 repeat domain-containing protein [Armatimonadota bacterium]|nr:WD40 repeat domain-containing protein [Armatimonadota bacterium]
MAKSDAMKAGISYVRRMRSKGVPDERIRASLRSSGWSEAAIEHLWARLGRRRSRGGGQAAGAAARVKQLLEGIADAIERGAGRDVMALAGEMRELPGYELDERDPTLLAHLAEAGRDGILTRTGLRDAWHVRTFEEHDWSVESVAISPDGWFALSGAGGGLLPHDNTVRLWELDSGQCLRVFKGHTACVNSVAISPDARSALSGSSDKTLRVWDFDSGDCVRTLREHRDCVNAVAISPHGRFGLSGGGDKTLRLWDLDSGQCLRTLHGHTDGVYAVAISADGRFALSGSSDNTLRLWQFDWEWQAVGDEE